MASAITHKKTANPGDLIRSADWNDTHNAPTIDAHLASTANPHTTTLQKACTADDDTTGIQFIDYGPLPPAAAALRGKTVIVRGASATESDKMYCCMKSAGGVGQWSVVNDFEVSMYGAYSMNGIYMVAVLSNGDIWRSSDGTTWTLEAQTGEVAGYCAGGNGVNLDFVGMKGAAVGQVYISNDAGDSWALDHSFAAGQQTVQRCSPIWFDNKMYFGLYGIAGSGDVYTRDGIGNYALSLNTTSKSITNIYISGVNGYLYVLTVDGELWEKQSDIGLWNLKHTFAEKDCRCLCDDGTNAYMLGGNKTKPVLYISTDYITWTAVTIPPTITSRYVRFISGAMFGGALYCGGSGGPDGADVIKYKSGAWSVDLRTGGVHINTLTEFSGGLYASVGGLLDNGPLYRLITGIESYTWITIAEG